MSCASVSVSVVSVHEESHFLESDEDDAKHVDDRHTHESPVGVHKHTQSHLSPPQAKITLR